MGESLRDQLLKSGLVPLRREPPARKQGDKPAKAKPPCGEVQEPGLAQAWAARARSEAADRRQAEQAAAETARQKRERKQQIQNLLAGKGLASGRGEHARHFSYGGKIRRIYVDVVQLKALNAGELGIVQQQGHYLLVERALALQVQALEPKLIALLVGPNAASDDDGVPDDLMW